MYWKDSLFQVKIDRTGSRLRIEVDGKTVTHELGSRADDLDAATFLHLGQLITKTYLYSWTCNGNEEQVWQLM